MQSSCGEALLQIQGRSSTRARRNLSKFEGEQKMEAKEPEE